MKRRAVQLFVVLFALWPALHRGLVAHYDANPWKGAGWAMYARPHFVSQVALLATRGGEDRPIARLAPLEQVLLDDYRERYFSLGRLASPERLARELLSQRGAAEAVTVVTTTPYFELSSARIRQRQERFVLRR